VYSTTLGSTDHNTAGLTDRLIRLWYYYPLFSLKILATTLPRPRPFSARRPNHNFNIDDSASSRFYALERRRHLLSHHHQQFRFCKVDLITNRLYSLTFLLISYIHFLSPQLSQFSGLWQPKLSVSTTLGRIVSHRILTRRCSEAMQATEGLEGLPKAVGGNGGH
jgi:hypothetical protein